MKQKPTLLMMRGLPSSGKTTWATEWANAKHNRLRVSWTDMLLMMGNKFRRQRRVLAFEAAVHLVTQALKDGKDVVVDEMNLDPVTWSLFQVRATQCGARMEWHTMATSVEECKRRNAARGYPVADMEIDRLAVKHAEWLKQK